MIKRRFFKIDHGDRDGSDHSSSSSDEDYDNQTAEVSHEESDDGDDNEVSSTSSGYRSEDSSANEIDANSTGQLFSEDDAGTVNEREILTNKELPSECDSEKSNVMAEEKPLPTDIPSTYVLKFKSVFKCRLCPRIICLTEDTLRNHLQSKRHARSEKLHKEGRLKAVLNSDGEIESQEVSEIQTEDTEDNTKKNDKGQKQHKKSFKKKKNDEANSRKTRPTKGSSKRSRKK
ncbi:uncharacterized protein [Cicer arietinum]|uniref:Uncharacterized protein LOC101495416 n=1 Tax=Cicer arietinum TaxID=3827 RepID=A0A3Q7YD94_CICAR|nr:uncharacterized protein LOC101495416 [Cicer arietinum]